MKGALHRSPPPGTITATSAAERLGMSRQNFNERYGQLFDRWQVGPGRGTLLYRIADIADLARWLTVRRGMIALGHWLHNTPGMPTDGEWHTAVHEGYWDVDCPKCGGDGVGLDDQVWCPECEK